MSDDLKLALVAAFSAVAGTIVGGLVAYLTSRDLQDREFERSDRARLIQAQAAASVELRRLVSARNLVESMRKTRNYPVVGDRLRDELSTTEHQLVISYLERTRINALDRATTCVNDLQNMLPLSKEGDSAPEHVLVTLGAVDHCVAGGEAALEPLTRRKRRISG
jgi:hypothetical protein